MTLAAGTKIEGYEVLGPLGAGGMGEVYRARDSALKRDVAIKVLPSVFSRDPDRLRRFEQEAQAAAALNHPNILVVYQFGIFGDAPYLVSELLEGSTLRGQLARSPIPAHKAIDYGVQLACGLAAAHEKGIVHRDLKPENIFITKDQRAKILDFGLAKLTQADAATPDGDTITLEEQTRPGEVLGTVGYMSPEQVRGKGVDHRTDIFAFGAILYEMVTSKRAFQKPTLPETMTAILNEEPPEISQSMLGTPPGLLRVMRRCLEKDPERRFQSASDLAFALESLSDSGIASGTEVPRPAHQPGRFRMAIVFVVAFLICLAVATTYVLTRPPAVPLLTNYVRLTTDGQPKSIVGTDGSRLYLFLGEAGSAHGLAQMSMTGGEVQKLPILSPDMVPFGVSPEGSNVLAGQTQVYNAGSPLLSIPILGGSPRRVGNILVQNAALSHEGTQLAYTLGGDLFVTSADGSKPQKIFSVNNPTEYLINVAWSPKGDRLRFARSNFSSTAMWEIQPDGSKLYPLLAPWRLLPSENGEMTWTPDGKTFLYVSRGQIWMLEEKSALFHREIKSVQLTSSPLVLSNPTPSRDGKKLFAVGYDQRGELMRFDMKSRQFTPFLGGISAEFASFSPDGQWVAYVLYPEGTLWRSKLDGTERLQLTKEPTEAGLPRWSPDGKKILVSLYSYPGPAQISVIPSDGGAQQALLPNDPLVQLDTAWSPDGKRLVIGGNATDPSVAIRMLDLATGHVETLPGSQGLFSPRWSPDGHYLAGLTTDQTRMMLFNFQEQSWKELVNGSQLGWLEWSRDGHHVYYLEQAGTISIRKIRISDGSVENVRDLKDFPLTGVWGNSLSLAPDDSPLLLRNIGTHDVYSLDLKEP
jgi:Tol biopolymer transport system component